MKIQSPFRISRVIASAVLVAAAALTACTATDPHPSTQPHTHPTTSTAPIVNPKPSIPAINAASDVHLTHRYSFTTDAKDSVGHADGALKGAAKVANGQLVLDNTSKTGADPSISYLELPASFLPKSASATIAFWLTASNTTSFARVMDFGDREGIQGRAFIYFTPSFTTGNNTGNGRAAISGTTTAAKTALDFPKIDDGKPHAVMIVINGAEKKLHLFVDGKEPVASVDLGANTLDLVRPVTNWVGRSLFDQDPGLTGSIDELRIYDKALTPDEAAALSAAGPDKIVPTK